MASRHLARKFETSKIVKPKQPNFMERKEFTQLKEDVKKVIEVISVVDQVTAPESAGAAKVTLPEWAKVGKATIQLISISIKYARGVRPLKTTHAEKVELMAFIEREFELRNKAAEALTETALNIIFSIAAAVKARQLAAENPN